MAALRLLALVSSASRPRQICLPSNWQLRRDYVVPMWASSARPLDSGRDDGGEPIRAAGRAVGESDAAAITWWPPQGLPVGGAADSVVLHRLLLTATASAMRSGRRGRRPRGTRVVTGKLACSCAVGPTHVRWPLPLVGTSPGLGAGAGGLGAALRPLGSRDGGSAEHLNEATSVAAMNDAALRPRRPASPTNFARLRRMDNVRIGEAEKSGPLALQRWNACTRVCGRSTFRPSGTAAAKGSAQKAASMLRAKLTMHVLGKSHGGAIGPEVPTRATTGAKRAIGGGITAGGELLLILPVG